MVAIVTTSVIFALVHLAAPGANAIALLDTAIAGVALAVGRLRSGALWLPIGWHFGWNFAMGSLFGCVVSGSQPTTASLFEVQLEGPAYLVGGPYGPESGLLAVAADLTALVLFWRFYSARLSQ